MSIPARQAPSAAAPGHVFVSYAREDAPFTLHLATTLKDRGLPVWIDQHDISPGENWSQAIDVALTSCVSFLIVLSPDAVASDEVQGELRFALNARKHIVPILYRSCDVPRSLLLRQYLDLTPSSEIGEADVDRLVRSLGPDRPQVAPALDDDRSSRLTLLDDVIDEAGERLRWIDRKTEVPILLQRQPHQVARAWDREAVGQIMPPAAPPTDDIMEVFDAGAVRGSLLILGAPGSGKTSLLLRVMEKLARRAKLDDVQPVPVLVSLASWRSDQPIGQWFVGELKAKYGVRTDLGIRWRDERRIAPLLDALDELPADEQRPCVEAINEFQRDYRPPSLVVCCRQEEYENLTVQLRLRGAVSLLPLESDQIRAYLETSGSAELWDAVRTDATLMELVRSPLFLSFISEGSGAPGRQLWQGEPSLDDRRRLVFETYLAAHAPDPEGSTYSRDQTRRWLGALATTLREQGLSEFLMERMQPDWLHGPIQRWAYRAGVLITSAAAVALVFHGAQAIFDLVPKGNVGLALESASWLRDPNSTVDRSLALMIVLAIAAVVASRTRIVPIETLTWSWSRAATNSARWAAAAARAGLDYGTVLGVSAALIWRLVAFDVSDEASGWQQAGEAAGFAAGVLVSVFLAIVRPSAWLGSGRRPAMTPPIRDALRASTTCALAIGCWALWGEELTAIAPLAVLTLASALTIFVIVGFSPASADNSRRHVVRWLHAGALSGATTGALVAVAMLPVMPSMIWLTVWLVGGLAVGTTVGLGGVIAPSLRRWFEEPIAVETAANSSRWTWGRTLGAALAVGLLLGVAGFASARSGVDQPVRNVTLFMNYFAAGLFTLIAAPLFVAIGGAVSTPLLAGVLGGLAGALSAATGADVQRRLTPNQGIRQSAVNIAVFALLGVVVIGVPYGVLNLLVATVVFRAIPSPGDVARMGVAPAVMFGLLAGLIPGAACIQHFVLRFVLWASGILPLRAVRFLNFAVHRRVLQRVGGRYRFVHVLLRDHLSDEGAGRATP